MAEIIAPPKSRGADVSGRLIAYAAIGLPVVVVTIAIASWLFLTLLDSGHTEVAEHWERPAAPRMPAPQLQTAAPQDLQALRIEKHAMLNGYRWMDRKAGVVQIPIERAMQLSVERSGKTAEPGK
jgi:hypothetical protein